MIDNSKKKLIDKKIINQSERIVKIHTVEEILEESDKWDVNKGAC